MSTESTLSGVLRVPWRECPQYSSAAALCRSTPRCELASVICSRAAEAFRLRAAEVWLRRLRRRSCVAPRPMPHGFASRAFAYLFVAVCAIRFDPQGTPNTTLSGTLGYSVQGPSGCRCVCLSGTPPIRFDAVVTLVRLATAEDNENVALQVLCGRVGLRRWVHPSMGVPWCMCTCVPVRVRW